MTKHTPIKCYLGLIAGFILSAQMLHAQPKIIRDNSDSLKSLVRLIVGWQNGLEWETRIGKCSTIDLFSGVGIGYQSDNFLDYRARIIFSPDAFAEYRNYYNLFKRISKQKNTRNNSANFLFGRVEVIFPVRDQNFINLMFMQGWGIQRSLWKRINADCHLGLIEHLYYDRPPSGGFNYIKIEPDIQGSISYVF